MFLTRYQNRLRTRISPPVTTNPLSKPAVKKSPTKDRNMAKDSGSQSNGGQTEGPPPPPPNKDSTRGGGQGSTATPPLDNVSITKDSSGGKGK